MQVLENIVLCYDWLLFVNLAHTVSVWWLSKCLLVFAIEFSQVRLSLDAFQRCQRSNA